MHSSIIGFTLKIKLEYSMKNKLPCINSIQYNSCCGRTYNLCFLFFYFARHFNDDFFSIWNGIELMACLSFWSLPIHMFVFISLSRHRSEKEWCSIRCKQGMYEIFMYCVLWLHNTMWDIVWKVLNWNSLCSISHPKHNSIYEIVVIEYNIL